jgi:hypothetical protein
MGSEHRIEDARASREAKLDALQERVVAAVESLITGEDWMRTVEFMAHFRSRSFGNVLLIQTQHQEAYREGRVPEPIPTIVAGFQQWKKLGRSVLKGQGGYMIHAPVTGRFASANPADASSWRRLGNRETPKTGEVVRSQLVGVKPAFVWDVSQTDGAPVPERAEPVLLRGQAPAGLWDGLAEQVVQAGFTIRGALNSESIGGANGLTQFGSGTVTIRDDMDAAARVKTLAHELAHISLGHGSGEFGGGGIHRGRGEVEAESVALMVTATYGMDSSGYTIPYVSGWASEIPGRNPVDVVRSTGERVRSAAMRILESLPEPPTSDGSLIGLDRSFGQPKRNRELSRGPGRQTPGASRIDSRERHDF